MAMSIVLVTEMKDYYKSVISAVGMVDVPVAMVRVLGVMAVVRNQETKNEQLP